MSAGSVSSTNSDEGEPLELVTINGRKLYRLSGRIVTEGSILEIHLEDCWVTGRFEWTGAEVRWPSLRMNLGGLRATPTQRMATVAMPLPPGAIMRWKA